MKKKGIIASNKFLTDIICIISQAKTNAIRSVDFERVIMYWKLGERIFVEEQQFNWMQYKLLIHIDDTDKREYYELEALHNAWNGREFCACSLKNLYIYQKDEVKMAKKQKRESLTDFLSHKVKDYAEYREFMKPRNSDHDINTLKFSYIPRLNHNKAL